VAPVRSTVLLSCVRFRIAVARVLFSVSAAAGCLSALEVVVECVRVRARGLPQLLCNACVRSRFSTIVASCIARAQHVRFDC